MQRFQLSLRKAVQSDPSIELQQGCLQLLLGCCQCFVYFGGVFAAGLRQVWSATSATAAQPGNAADEFASL